VGTGELRMRCCTVCRKPAVGTFIVSLREEISCGHHRDVVRCGLCGHVGDSAERASWSTLREDLPRCPVCTGEAVLDQEDVRRELPGIRARAKQIGFVLPTPVRVGLLPAGKPYGDAVDTADSRVFGLTFLAATGARTADVVMIQILAGLPATLFGAVVSHELGHAWLAQNGSRPTEPLIEEGFCELVAHASLKPLRTPFAAGLRRQIRDNPDPVYGAGFRQVQSSVRRHGIKNVLANLASTGALPVAGRQKSRESR
jgi:hypothetical protein